jgi:DNA invertase Pin-like site-specific DNA recombinase
VVPCVLYAAKSNEDVHGSLGTQVDDCRRGVADAGGERVIVAELFDEAVSGFKRSRGPGLAEALREAEALASEHGGSELWVQHSDRLARGDGRVARHLVEVALWALKANVAVRSIEDPDTFRDLLYAVVTGQRNHEDSRRKGAASAAGVKRAVYRGEYTGQPLDGYRVVVTANDRGHVTKRLEIDPEREALFRMIFRMAKRGAMPTRIARRANRAGWTTAPRRVDHRPGPITPRFVQWVLDHPRYAGLAVHKGEVVGNGQWPAYISSREHKQLGARVRQYKSPKRPREPFLLAHLASCGLCGDYMITLTGKPRLDGTRRRTYVCHGHRTQRCKLPPLDAAAIDHVLVASLNRFLGGLEETEPYRPSPGFPRELIRGHARPAWESIQPIATVTAELRVRIGHALRMEEHEPAEALIEELLDHRERLRASIASGPRPKRQSLELSEEPRKLLFDFYAWSANDLDGRLTDRPQDTARLNRVLRRWFARIVLRPVARGIEIAPTLTPGSGAHLPDPTPAYADPDQWQVALRIGGRGHRYGDRWGDGEILHAIRTWASVMGRAPHVNDWTRATPEHPHPNVVIKKFGRWNLAISAAGLTPTPPPAIGSTSMKADREEPASTGD